MSMKNYHLNVETLQSGQAKPYQDSFYRYRIEDKSEPALSKYLMLDFCMSLKRSYPADKIPDPFAGRRIKFFEAEPRVWEYEVRSEFTG
jgi:hypothetical protein